MDSALRRLVSERAKQRCEYCQLPQEFDAFPFEIDHIIAEKHLGQTIESNLALSCYQCNAYKGSNIAGIDVITEHLVPLFHPRQQLWTEHFEWDGPELHGRTAIGRTTVDVLRINHPSRVDHRRELMAAFLFPLRSVAGG